MQHRPPPVLVFVYGLFLFLVFVFVVVVLLGIVGAIIAIAKSGTDLPTITGGHI